jgi:hypothetical protein
MKMENVKLRLDYFLSLGLKLVEKDGLDHVMSCAFTIHDGNATCFREVNRGSKNYFITSLAPRENTGEQPCGDDAMVYVDLSNGDQVRWLAKHFEWTGAGDYVVETWKPDIEAIIKMQIEFDKNKHCKKFDDAIDLGITAEDMEYAQETFDAAMANAGHAAINPKRGDKVRIEHKLPMEEAATIHTATFMFETGHEICLIDVDGDGFFVDKSCFIAYHPVKSELDIAKEKQVNEFYNAIVDASESVAIESLKWMQDNNMLAAIRIELKE